MEPTTEEALRMQLPERLRKYLIHPPMTDLEDANRLLVYHFALLQEMQDAMARTTALLLTPKITNLPG